VGLGTDNVDSIKDFVTAEGDKIVMSKSIFGAIATAAGASLAAGEFVAYAGSIAKDANDHVIYNTVTGALFYDADGTGALAAIRFAVVGTTTHPSLSATDILIVT